MQRQTDYQYLYQTINDERDEDFAITLINRLKIKTPESLTTLDTNGKSFLNLALHLKLKNLADHLLELQKDNEQIIFGMDTNKQTCFLLAAKQGYLDIMQKISALAKDTKPNTPGYKIWLKSNTDGNTPLHVAAENGNLEITQFLLGLIEKDKDIINYLNYKNMAGNSPLHLACQNPAFPSDLIALLIENGADFSIINHYERTPYDSIHPRDLDEQKQLVSKLNNKQAPFLEYCYKHAMLNRKDANIKNNYRQLNTYRNELLYKSAINGFNSIVAIVAKNKVVNNIENIIIPDGLILQEDNPSAPSTECDKAVTNNEDINIPDDLRFEEDSLSEPSTKCDEEWILLSLSEEQQVLQGELYQLLDADLKEINNLIELVQNDVADLQGRPKKQCSISNTSIAFAVVIGIIGLDIFLGFKANEYKILASNTTNIDIDKKDEYRTIQYVCILGIVSITMLSAWSLFIISLADSTFRKPAEISSEEWESFTGFIQAMLVLEKLKALQETEQKDQENNPHDEIKYLPTSEENILELENILNIPNEKISIDVLIRTFTDLNSNLVKLKNDMQRSNKPYSRFFQPAKNDDAVIDITDELHSDEDSHSSFSDNEGGMKLLNINPNRHGYGTV